MSRPRRRRRIGKSVLTTISLLFLASGLLRMFDGTGAALARGLAAVEIGREDEQETLFESCEPDAEIRATLQLLRDRAAELDEREAEIAYRAQSLKVAEEEVRINLAALQSAEESLKATLALADGAAEADLDRLTNVYQSMKPKDAAAVFEEMDPSFAAGFLARMRPEVAAEVLAGLSSQKAYTVSVVLAGRNTGVPVE
ncbi:MotE family protein [Tropicimonas sediminicola]|uniref:MgtE intracellular N domain-containing protein n=1 Tax=Tropicimonas sediminicola TaxID=1031541 RepID=A0A239JD53_9RHOB|nr:hypothetical protein [Tropicimonas sediminicola]SNT03775.1 MgtE intracellular N domain-containing protein [Tropicimonas sediminicola]